jgi:8-oxo-dGTP pyrophosphatase MutT (NUDIX family)
LLFDLEKKESRVSVAQESGIVFSTIPARSLFQSIMKDTFIQQLAERLQGPLPGREAQYRMAHAVRTQYPHAAEHARKAGVLALFYPKDDRWHIVLIERDSRNPNDRHRGQISFPGGQFEPGDQTLANTALREAEEEVGAPAKDIQLLGALTELYIPVSNFSVSPYVGMMNYAPTFSPQQEEVNDILEVPFELFTDPGNVRQKDMAVGPNGSLKLRGVPYFHIFDRTVWGATAMMLNELVELLGGDL